MSNGLPRTTKGKAFGGGAGGGVGAALATMALWGLNQQGVYPPAEVGLAIEVLIGAVGGFIGAWLPRNREIRE